jgi:hypothetical protein
MNLDVRVVRGFPHRKEANTAEKERERASKNK